MGLERFRETPHEEIIAGCLAWCNEQRERLGKEPLAEMPKGIRRDPFNCPCGDACGMWVGITTAFDLRPGFDPNTVSDGNEKWNGVDRSVERSLPPIVAEFVGRFDEGEIPELVEESA